MIKAGNTPQHESTEVMSESAKIVNMTKGHAQGYEGHWQLPSGKPGQVASTSDCELSIVGDGESNIQVMLMDEDGSVYAKFFSAKDESRAVNEFKSIAAAMNDLMDAKKFAKKFGLKSM